MIKVESRILDRIPMLEEDVLEMEKVYYMYESTNTLLDRILSNPNKFPKEVVDHYTNQFHEYFEKYNKTFDKFVTKYSTEKNRLNSNIKHNISFSEKMLIVYIGDDNICNC